MIRVNVILIDKDYPSTTTQAILVTDLEDNKKEFIDQLVNETVNIFKTMKISEMENEEYYKILCDELKTYDNINLTNEKALKIINEFILNGFSLRTFINVVYILGNVKLKKDDEIIECSIVY